MGEYGRDRSGGRSGGGSRFGGGFGWGGRWGRDSGRGERPELFSATCAECGSSCEVPFKPTGERPVYCSDCFRDMEWGRGERDSGRRDFWDRGRGDRWDRGWRDFGGREEKRMYPAVCGQCGNDCEVPFKPSPDKPVYCSDCFITDDKSKFKKQEELKLEFTKMNAKLDMIIKHLGITEEKKEVKKIKLDKVVKEEADEVFGEEVAEVVKKEKKDPVKKAAVKKAPKK